MNDTIESISAFAKIGNIVRHLLQMILAMAAGMAVFIGLFNLLLTSNGYLALQTGQPLLWFVLMSVFMTVPMVAWMRYQGHSWRQCTEMTVAMLAPPAIVTALVQFGVTVYPFIAAGTLSHSTHITMLLGMVAFVLYRRDQYSGARRGDAPMRQTRAQRI
jgi:hypothetical protein